MKKMKSVMFALSVVALMFSAALTVTIAGNGAVLEDQSAAQTEVDLTNGYIVAVTVQGTPIQLAGQRPYWQQPVSTGAVVNYSLTTTAGSPLALNLLNVTWRLETDLNTTIFSYGANVSYIWYAEATHAISVTYINATNASDIGRQFIGVQVKADFDEDEIGDLWERQFFHNLGTADGTTDYDLDGWTDIEEFQNGTDPTKVNAKPGFLEQYLWLFMVIALVLVAILLVWFVIMPKTKAKRDAEEKKKIAAAVDVEKSLLGLDDLEDKPKK